MRAMEIVAQEWVRARSTRRAWCIVVSAAILVALVAFAHADHSGAVATAEHQLKSGYLDPLTRGRLATEVLEACHYGRTSPHDPWHFSVKIAVRASTYDVVKALARDVGVIRSDRNPVIVQQFKGAPQRGWNGIIEPSATGTLISVVKNNVDVSANGPGVGWMPICPESKPGG
jgi:hypothetical protein